MAYLTIGPEEFLQGESPLEYDPKGGFSSISYGLNLDRVPGVLYFSPSATDRGSTTLTGKIIASADDQNLSHNDKYFLDEEGAFYRLDGVTFVKRQTAPAGTFQEGTSDMLQFGLVTYATSTDGLWALTGSDLDSLDKTTTLSLTTGYRHPMERVESEVFIGNKNLIYYFDNAGNTGTAFTLPPEINVTSLRKHPDGRTLLAFCGTLQDLAHAEGGDGRVYFCNPRTRLWDREVQIATQVEGTRVVGGIVYATWGKTFGYFNGNGLVPLKKFLTSGTTYSHAISNMDDIVITRDGLNVLAFGDLGSGSVWWRPYRNNTDSNNINCVTYKGSDVLLVGFGDATTGILHEVDLSTAGTNGILYTKRYYFPQQIKVRRIEVLHTDTSTSRFILANVATDDAGTVATFKDATYTAVTSNKTRVDNPGIVTDILQFRLQPITTGLGFRQIRVHYDPID